MVIGPKLTEYIQSIFPEDVYLPENLGRVDYYLSFVEKEKIEIGGERWKLVFIPTFIYVPPSYESTAMVPMSTLAVIEIYIIAKITLSEGMSKRQLFLEGGCQYYIDTQIDLV